MVARKPSAKTARLNVPASQLPAPASVPEVEVPLDQTPSLGGDYVVEGGVRRLVRRAGVQPQDLQTD